MRLLLAGVITAKEPQLMLKTKIPKSLPTTHAKTSLERKCLQRGVRISATRCTILNILEQSKKYLTVEDIYRYSLRNGADFSLSTIYTNTRRLANAGVIQRRNFKSKQSYYAVKVYEPRDQLTDIESGEVIEFRNKSLDKLKAEMAREYGFNIEGCRVELYVQVSKKPHSDKQL